MIIKTSTGVLLHGTLAKDPEIRNAGQKQVLKFDIKAHSVKNAAGNWEGLYVQVNVWHGLEQWDGMLQKGGHGLCAGAEEPRIQRQDLLQRGR